MSAAPRFYQYLEWRWEPPIYFRVSDGGVFWHWTGTAWARIRPGPLRDAFMHGIACGGAWPLSDAEVAQLGLDVEPDGSIWPVRERHLDGPQVPERDR